MKSYLSKLGVLLFGAMFAVAACQDYDEEIRKVNDKLTADKAELTEITEELDKAIAALEEKHDADFAKVKADLKDLADDLAAAEKALEEAYKAADADLKKGYEDADKDLQAKINKAVEDATAAISGLQTALDAAKTELKKGYEDADAALRKEVLAYVDNKVTTLKSELQTLIDVKVAELQAADAVLTAAIKKEQDAREAGDKELTDKLEAAKKEAAKNLADAKAEIATNLMNAKKELIAADSALQAQITTLTADVKANKDSIATLQQKLADAQKELQDAIDAEEEARINGDAETLKYAKAYSDEKLADAKAELTKKHEEDIKDVKDLIASEKAALQAAIKAEETARAAADSTLQAAIKAEEAARLAADGTLTASIGSLSDKLDEYIETTDKKIAALEDADKALEEKINKVAADLEEFKKKADEIYATKDDLSAEKARLDELYQHVTDIKHDVANEFQGVLATIETLNKRLQGLEVDVETLTARIQSIVYVPEYSDGKATINAAIVPVIERDQKPVEDFDLTFIPVKDTLRYKVNSTSETAVADLVAAYEADPTILSFDLEGVTVRGASAGDAVLEIVGAYEDEDGYLAVEVLAKNFDPEFYYSTIACEMAQWEEFYGQQYPPRKEYIQALYKLATQYPDTKGYSAALVLNQADQKTNVASEFTNLIAGKDFKILNLVVESEVKEDKFTMRAYDVDLEAMYPHVNYQYIASNDTTAVYTAPSTPYIEVWGDDNLYTAEELYEVYGIKAEIKQHQHVVSYTKEGKVDSSNTFSDLCWEDSIVLYNKDKFNVVDPNAVGTSREVTLPACADQQGYNDRVGSYIEVVDSYFLGGQAVAIADYIEITKNIVRIDFEEVVYDWTLQKAIDLRAEDGTPYAKDIVLEGVEYNNIYDLKPLLSSSKTEIVSSTLNNKNSANIIKVTEIAAPKDGKNGTGTVVIKPGYEFAAATAETGNKYVKVWKSELSETTDAIVTVTIVLGNYPGLVTVESEVELELVAGETWFDGKDALIEDAYAEFGADNAGFAEDAKVNDLMFAALTDEDNTIVNDPNSLYNMNFVVNENVDNSWVRLYETQIEDNANVAESYVFTRDITTWFGVPFKFIVTGKPQLPEVELVRSTEYASATDTEKVYAVQLDARVIDGVYTVKQSDLGFYLNTIGEANETQRVTFAVVEGNAEIANQTVNVEPLEAPISNPLIGADITAYLQKEEAILTWKDKGTQVKVKATLWAGAYPVDYATLILTVEDPIKFSAKDVTKERIVEGVTVAKVFEGFELYSTAKAADGKPAFAKTNLVDIKAADLASILPADVVTAFGINITTEMVSMYEKVGEGVNDKVLYDSSKYVWEPEKGILTLKQDDAAELLNPIVAHIRVTFTHNVHGTSDACSVVKDIFVTFQQTK